MGIGNHTPLTRWASRFVTSLPLMGIGNLAREIVAPAGVILITPHGDREPPERDPAPAALEDSLPLMGIGNGPG